MDKVKVTAVFIPKCDVDLPEGEQTQFLYTPPSYAFQQNFMAKTEKLERDMKKGKDIDSADMSLAELDKIVEDHLCGINNWTIEESDGSERPIQYSATLDEKEKRSILSYIPQAIRAEFANSILAKMMGVKPGKGAVKVEGAAESAVVTVDQSEAESFEKN